MIWTFLRNPADSDAYSSVKWKPYQHLSQTLTQLFRWTLSFLQERRNGGEVLAIVIMSIISSKTQQTVSIDYCLFGKWKPSSTTFELSPLIQFDPIHADITFWMDLSWWWIQSVKHFHCSFVSSMCWPVRWIATAVYSIQSNYVTIYHNCAFGDALPKPLIVVHSCQQHAKISLFNKWNKKFRVFFWHDE